MNYFELYKNRLSGKNNLFQERNSLNLKNKFDRIIYQSLNFIEITLLDSNLKIPSVLQIGAGNKKDTKVTKELLINNDYDLNPGQLFFANYKDRNEIWMIIEKEYKPFDSYNKYNVVQMTHKFSYTDIDGEKKDFWAFVGTKTSSSWGNSSDLTRFFDVSQYLTIETPNLDLIGIAPDSSYIKKGNRIILGNKTWEFQQIENYIRPGIANFYLSEVYTVLNNEQEAIIPLKKEIVLTSNYGDNINISLQNTDLQFLKKENNSLDLLKNYSITKIDETKLVIQEDKIIPISIGTTEIEINYKNFIKNFQVSIVENSENKGFVLNDKIKQETKNFIFTFNLDINKINFTLENNSFGEIKKENNLYYFSSFDKIGKTKISCYENNNLIFEQEIEVISIWE